MAKVVYTSQYLTAIYNSTFRNAEVYLKPIKPDSYASNAVGYAKASNPIMKIELTDPIELSWIVERSLHFYAYKRSTKTLI